MNTVRPRNGDLRRVVAGLGIAFAVHDLEEILTAPSTTRLAQGLVRHLPPRVAEHVPDIEVTRTQMSVAVAVVGTAVAAIIAAASGPREPRLKLFAHAVAVFGAHGLTHAAQAAVAGTYAPGVATVPVAVLPYSVWALRQLQRAGVLTYREIPAMIARGVAPAVALAAIGHTLGRHVSGRSS